MFNPHNPYEEDPPEAGGPDAECPPRPAPIPMSPKATYGWANEHTVVQVTYDGGDMVQLALQDRHLRNDITRDNGWIVTHLPLDVWYSLYAHVADRLPSVTPTSPPPST